MIATICATAYTALIHTIGQLAQLVTSPNDRTPFGRAGSVALIRRRRTEVMIATICATAYTALIHTIGQLAQLVRASR